MSFPSALRGSESFESCLNRRNCTCGVFDRFVTVEFFCGSSAECRLSWESSKDDPDPDLERKRKEVFQRTLTHIEKFYAAVLILENLKQSIQILEISLPQYFTGISGIDLNVRHNVNEYDPLENVTRARKVYCQRQPFECQLYEYLTQRMEKQIKALLH